MRTKILILSTFVLFALPWTVGAQGAIVPEELRERHEQTTLREPRQGSVLLTFRAAQGSTARYNATITVEASGASETFSGIVVDRIVSVNRNRYVVESTWQNSGRREPGIKRFQDSWTSTYRSNGELISITGPNIREEDERISRICMVVVPGHEVKTGDRWHHSYNPRGGRGGHPIAYEYTAGAIRRHGNHRVMEIHFSASETTGGGTVSAFGTVLANVDDGSLVSYEANIFGIPLQDQPGFATVKMKIERYN